MSDMAPSPPDSPSVALASAPGPARHSGPDWAGRASQFGLPFAILVVIIAGTLISPVFLSVDNFLNIATSMSIVGIVAVGMCFVLVAGGLADLSVPATIACGALLALGLQPTLGVEGAMLAGLLTATLAGAINGAIIAYGGVNAIIVTLGTGAIILGAAQWAVGGVIVYGSASPLAMTLRSDVLGIPMVVIIFAIVALLGHILLSRTIWGRWTLATGGNRAGARASAVPVKLVLAGAFTLTGFAAGISGVLLGLTLQAARPEVGAGYEFASITAVVVGGISIAGGFGSIPRVIGGLIFVQLLTNVMVLAGVRTPVQGLALGLLIAGAVAADIALRKREVS